MKFVNTLTSSEMITLDQLYKYGPSRRLSQRAHIIIMSHHRISMNDIAKLTFLDRDTISCIINNWESIGIIGLYDKKRSGRPPIFSSDDEINIINEINKEPRSLKKATSEINKKTHKNASRSTVKRILKKHKKIWKRMKRTLAGTADLASIHQAQQDIRELQSDDSKGIIDLYYYDESGFSLTPYIPYGWQNIGERIELPSSRSQRVNVMGFLRCASNELISWVLECGVDSEMIIAIFDEFSKNLTKKTVIILDNASFHRSNKIREKISQWEENNLFLYYLPPYSPKLNAIERLWQFMKYHWISLEAYHSFENLKKSVNSMLSGYGEKYLITFD